MCNDRGLKITATCVKWFTHIQFPEASKCGVWLTVLISRSTVSINYAPDDDEDDDFYYDFNDSVCGAIAKTQNTLTP